LVQRSAEASKPPQLPAFTGVLRRGPECNAAKLHFLLQSLPQAKVPEPDDRMARWSFGAKKCPKQARQCPGSELGQVAPRLQLVTQANENTWPTRHPSEPQRGPLTGRNSIFGVWVVKFP
jgi:hypothetical protein